MSAPKNQHLLPRFYLSGFCNPEVHRREGHERDKSRCRVWTHDKEQGRIRERGVKNLSVERHYYSADTPGGGRDAEPERVLAGLEDRAARVIRGLQFGSELRPEQEGIFAVFAASMKFRISSYRPFSRSHAARNETRIKEAAFPSVEALIEDLRRAGRPEAEDSEFVERVFREVRSDEYELKLTKNHDIEHMFRHTRKVAGVMLEQEWIFAWAPDGTSFATSDDPVLVLDLNLKAPKDFMGGFGFASAGVTKVLPLTQCVCLIIGSSRRAIGHVRLDRETVRQLNLEQTRHYARWLIARDEALVRCLVGRG